MIEEILIKWYKVHKIAEENPRLLCRTMMNAEEATQISDICGKRMQACDEADKELFKLEDVPLVNLFKEAEANLTNCGCLLQMRTRDHHPECWAKLREWFGYREALMSYVYQRYILHTHHIKECAEGKVGIAKDMTEIILKKIYYTQDIGQALGNLPKETYRDLEDYITSSIENIL